MAYITPDGTIDIFGDISLSPGQEDTLFFPNTVAKDAYFTATQKLMTFTSQSYTRKERGYIRVEALIGDLYGATYMRFKNSSFENKWFYAFILSVNYINNVTVEIQFEIDVVMTWMGDFQLGQCFIERQHTVQDNIGDNIIDEGIPCGDYKFEFIEGSGWMGNTVTFCLASTFNPTQTGLPDANGSLYGGIYSGVKYSYTSDYTVLNGWINTAVSSGKSDGILGISVVPTGFLTIEGADPPERQKTITKPYTDVDGYTPKNNKLFCYPYKSIQVTNCEGNFGEFRYEFFGGNSAQFELTGITGLKSEVVCTPLNYKGVQQNLSEKMSMSDFPLCSWITSPFQAYLAQNKSSISADVISSVGSLGADLILGGMSPKKATNATVGALSDIANTVGSLLDYARKPPQAGGSQGTSAIIGRTQTFQRKDFYFLGKQITQQYARVIDNYFTMFGYKLNRIGTPNMGARPYYTYVKTIDCVVHGNIPADDCRIIEEHFNRGIRFWRNHTQIGNYSLNNAPV